MKMYGIVTAAILFVVIIGILAFEFASTGINHKAQYDEGVRVLSSIVTTDIITIEELQNTLSENKGLFAENTIIVGRGYAVILENDNIKLICPITRHIESKKEDVPKTDEKAGTVGAEP